MFPIVVVWYGQLMWSLIRSQSYNFIEELGPRLIQSAIAGLPFVFLSLWTAVALGRKNPGARKGMTVAGYTIMAASTLVWAIVWAGPPLGLLDVIEAFLLTLAYIPVSILLMLLAYLIGSGLPTDAL